MTGNAEGREERPSRGGPAPESDAVEWERTVRAIVDAGGPELARRRSEAENRSEGLLLDHWARPLLAAAAAVILLAAGGLVWSAGAGPRDPGAIPSGLEEALYPPVVARWIGEDVQPTVEEMAFTEGGYEEGEPR